VSFSDQETTGQTILVVEDEVMLRLDLSQQLRQGGFDVIEADGADEAVALLENTHIDAVVTDIRMPGDIDGRDLVVWVRRKIAKAKIVVVSAYVDPTWNLPADVILPKPVRIEKLLQTLRQILPPGEHTGPGGS
jgi:CheY-like chemotaxis protein